MAFIDKLMFWKKKDDFEAPKPDFGLGMDPGLPKDRDLGLGNIDKGPGFPGSFDEPPRPSFEQPSFAQPMQPPFSQPINQPQQSQKSEDG